MIGIFDSGVGGMTVARAVEKALPSMPLVYFGDTARTPYGPKSAETLIRYSIENTEFLLAHGARMIVIACNSASSVASDTLRQRFEVPIFEVISPAVDRALQASTSGRIGIIGTRATIRSGVYETKILARAAGHRVYSQACPLLVPLVEEGWLSRSETKMILRRYLAPLKQKQIDTLVLGCTHYPLLKELIGPRIGGKRVTLIDSSEEVTQTLLDFLATNPALAESLDTGGQSSYYVSDATEVAASMARKIFGRRIALQQAAL